ncbi:hypothetical protein [Faecalicoccus sp.]|uniref:hypothetical protein n=1 Tax=Faecalicoccus sp. TaxID=1971758 RepID=UPI002639A8EC|nr:hypothetical protein [Faecalicoccus sp.]
MRKSLPQGIDTEILFHFLAIGVALPVAILFIVSTFAKIIQIQKDIAYTKVKKVFHSSLCICVILVGTWVGFTKGVLPALDLFYLNAPQTVVLYNAQLSHNNDFSRFEIQGQDQHQNPQSYKLTAALLRNFPLQKGQLTLPGETIQLKYYPFTDFVVSIENIS